MLGAWGWCGSGYTLDRDSPDGAGTTWLSATGPRRRSTRRTVRSAASAFAAPRMSGSGDRPKGRATGGIHSPALTRAMNLDRRQFIYTAGTAVGACLIPEVATTA